MLVLDKKLILTLRPKEKSSGLLRALLLSLTFHLLFFLIFKVGTLITPEKAAPLPFTLVDIDLPIEEPKVALVTAKDFFATDQAPSFSQLPLPQPNVGPTPTFLLMEPDFSTFEKLPYETPWKERE